MFRNSITDVHIGVSAIQDVIKNAINFTDTLFEVQEELDFTLYAREVNETAICNVPDQICAVRPVICEKAEDVSSQVRDTIGTLIGQIKDLRVQLDGTLDGVSNDLQTVHDMTEDVTGYLELSNIFFIVLISITVVLSALVVAMIVSVFLAWKGIQNCFTKCIQYAIIWPVFILLLILSWIFAMLFLATSVAGADFCMDPDKHVQALLEIGVYGADGASAVESIAVDLIMFYIQVSSKMIFICQTCNTRRTSNILFVL
jgi:flagellar biosynthesis protein FliQ